MRFRLLLSFASLVALSSVNGEEPFDFNATPGKLPKEVVPTEYAIRVKPDLKALTFSGAETVKLDVRKPVRKLVLNALQLRIADGAIDGQPLPAASLTLDAKEQTLTVALPNELTAGTHTLALSFTGKINEQGSGLFYCRYQEHGSGAAKTMLGTQFEATDARRFFPCWDEPSFRARFQLTAVVPENFLAVSNMPIEHEQKVEGGKEVRFGMTPAMASYLNVFVTGELDLIETKVGETQIRVIATKGKAEQGRYALESSAQILKFYNDYFGVPYPLPKLDQIALPGGFGGAMENWGGITYYESALLFDPAKSSDATRKRVFAVIAHEMAHQWFGDLVTMAWWDNLWLNEGFASWMGSKCTAHFNPQWEVWLATDTPRDPTRRSGMAKETAMEGDARSTTHPIQQKILTEADANGAFDDITYKKGQSFIRMLESFLGPDVFRDGIRQYMAAHKNSNTTTADLWAALAKVSGRDVAKIATSWTEQPGFPVIIVNREDGAKVALTQERFTVNVKEPSSLLWPIPVTYALAESAPQTVLMTKKTMALPNVPLDKPLKLNVDGTGNYRVQYDAGSWKLLRGELKALSEADRVNLLSDSWALFQANRAPLSLYLGLIEKLPASAGLAEREQVMNSFAFINQLLAGTKPRGAFQNYARGLLRPIFDQIGWEPKKDEPARSATLRADLIDALGDLNDPAIVAGCRERFQKYLDDPNAIPPDLRPAILNVVGRYADEGTWDKLHELGRKTTSIEEKQNYYDALTQTTDPRLVKEALQIAVSDELPVSRAISVVPRVARYSDHPEMAWQFAQKHMKELLAKTDALGANRYAPGLFNFFSETARATELKQFAQKNLPAESHKAVAQAIDEITFRTELKQRLVPQITEWTAAATKSKP